MLVWADSGLSGRFSPLFAPLPVNLFFNTRSPLRSRSPYFPPAPFHFPLSSRSAHMLCCIHTLHSDHDWSSGWKWGKLEKGHWIATKINGHERQIQPAHLSALCSVRFFSTPAHRFAPLIWLFGSLRSRSGHDIIQQNLLLNYHCARILLLSTLNERIAVISGLERLRGLLSFFSPLNLRAWFRKVLSRSKLQC